MYSKHNNINRNYSLEKWLSQRCDMSRSIYDDPGYSDHYKSMFGITDNGKIYHVTQKPTSNQTDKNKNNETMTETDLDMILNTAYTEDIFYETNKTLTDIAIQPYIDYVSTSTSDTNINNIISDYPEDKRQDIIKKLSRKCVVILPGTNQSNANYFYKILMNDADIFDSYIVPNISADPTKPYDGSADIVGMSIDKKKTYEFVRDNSVHSIYC